VELPYRPACVDWAKGTQGHKHGFHQCWPLKLLNIVVGAVNVPGGIMSTSAAGERPQPRPGSPSVTLASVRMAETPERKQSPPIATSRRNLLQEIRVAAEVRPTDAADGPLIGPQLPTGIGPTLGGVVLFLYFVLQVLSTR
jgi:anaerobic selenocysteine-containing dehydrogenase